MYYDTMTVTQSGTLWATESYAHIYSYDTVAIDYAEFVRYTADGKTGYELYAIGSVADMDTNVSVYAAIIVSVTFPTVGSSDAVRRAFPRGTTTVISGNVVRPCDLLGRNVSNRTFGRIPGVTVAGAKRRLIIR